MLDVEFAEHLGVSQPHWSMVKRGHRSIGRRMAMSIIRRYPDLWPAVERAMFGEKTAGEVREA